MKIVQVKQDELQNEYIWVTIRDSEIEYSTTSYVFEEKVFKSIIAAGVRYFKEREN